MKYFQCTICYAIVLDEGGNGIIRKKCPNCGRNNLRPFDNNTAPEKVLAAQLEEHNADKKTMRSCNMIDNGRDFQGRELTYKQRLSLGFRMLGDFFVDKGL